MGRQGLGQSQLCQIAPLGQGGASWPADMPPDQHHPACACQGGLPPLQLPWQALRLLPMGSLHPYNLWPPSPDCCWQGSGCGLFHAVQGHRSSHCCALCWGCCSPAPGLCLCRDRAPCPGRAPCRGRAVKGQERGCHRRGHCRWSLWVGACWQGTRQSPARSGPFSCYPQGLDLPLQPPAGSMWTLWLGFGLGVSFFHLFDVLMAAGSPV